MSFPQHIVDPLNEGHKMSVSSIGEGIVRAAYAYDDTAFNEMTATGTAYNFYPPKTGFQFVITFIRLKASRSVSNTIDATIILYEADSVTETTVGITSPTTYRYGTSKGLSSWD